MNKDQCLLGKQKSLFINFLKERTSIYDTKPKISQAAY